MARRALVRLLLTEEAFQTRYWSDPAAFVLDCFKWDPGKGPTPYQLDILRKFPENKRTAIRGPHGLGKTALAAWLIIWFSLTRDGRDWKIPTTAGSSRQLIRFLWPEIHKWTRNLIWAKIGRKPFDDRNELVKQNLNLRTGQAFAATSDKPDLIEGAHAAHLLYIFDEGKAIMDSTYDAAEGAFASESDSEAYALLTSTPGDVQGRFYDIHTRKPGHEDWSVRHVKIEEAIAAGRITREWVEQRKRQWGENSSLFQNRVLGEFATSDADGVIPLSWAEKANDRWRELQENPGPTKKTDFVVISEDVADGGADDTVIAIRRGMMIERLEVYPEARTMEGTGIVASKLKANRFAVGIVDADGVGAGVYGRLEELGLNIEPFKASEKADETDQTGELEFINRRAWAWWNLREMLDPSNGEAVALPPDDMLIGDLTAPKIKPTSSGKIQIESKQDIKKRLGRSTDRGDAVVMAFTVNPAKRAIEDDFLLSGSRRESLMEEDL